MFRTWVYVVVAAAIALIAFAFGQLLPGLGVLFVIVATISWTGYSSYRQRGFNPPASKS
jgi:hypothetical protein